MLTKDLVQGYPIISGQVSRSRLEVVLRAFEQVLNQNVQGDIVEFGCYIGTTSLFLRRMLDGYDQSGKRQLHVYDSFTGLPEKGTQDFSPAGEQFKAGELAVSKKQLLQEFRKANLTPPIVHKGWFNGLDQADVPPRIAFAFLDGDFYDSIVDSLWLVWQVIDLNGVIAIDDFGREALPGVERAVHAFLQTKPGARLRVEHNIAVIKP